RQRRRGAFGNDRRQHRHEHHVQRRNETRFGGGGELQAERLGEIPAPADQPHQPAGPRRPRPPPPPPQPRRPPHRTPAHPAPARASPGRHSRRRSHAAAPNATPATPKRAANSEYGGTFSTSSLTTGNVPPQIIVISSSPSAGRAADTTPSPAAPGAARSPASG